MPSRDLGAIFDEDPDLYDRARPGYPRELFDDLLRVAGLTPGARVVEIGPGTGQATSELLARGLRVTAVEPGAGLAGVLRRKCVTTSLEVAIAGFEAWRPDVEPFDAVVAFTAWHWLDPALRTARAALLLRPRGALATVTTTHVAGAGEAFFVEAQDCYERWDPATPPGLRLSAPADIGPALDEVDTSGEFSPPVRFRYVQDVRYSTAEYLDVLATYSGHRALPPERRRGLFGCIRELLDSRYGGRVTKRYLYELRVARRLAVSRS